MFVGARSNTGLALHTGRNNYPDKRNVLTSSKGCPLSTHSQTVGEFSLIGMRLFKGKEKARLQQPTEMSASVPTYKVCFFILFFPALDINWIIK